MLVISWVLKITFTALYGKRVELPKVSTKNVSQDEAIKMCREQNASLSVNLPPEKEAKMALWIGLLKGSDGPKIDDGAYNTISRYVNYSLCFYVFLHYLCRV